MKINEILKAKGLTATRYEKINSALIISTKEGKLVYKKNPLNILVPVISLIAIIIGTLAIGFAKSFIIILIIDLIYYIPNIRKRKNKTYGSNKNREKLTKENKKKKWLLIVFIAFIALFACIVVFSIFIVISAPKFDPQELYSTVPSSFVVSII